MNNPAPRFPPRESQTPSPPIGFPDVSSIEPDAMRIHMANVALNDKLPGLVQTESTAILLDINNLYKVADNNGWRIDYASLRSIFAKRCDLRHIAAFSATSPASASNEEKAKSQRWLSFMRGKGYHLITKDLKRYTNKEGEIITKGNMDIEIAIEAMSLSDGFAHVILGTCDGDFIPLVEKLKEGHLRKVSVIGITSRDWTGMDQNLKAAADNFYDLSAIKDHVSLQDRT